MPLNNNVYGGPGITTMGSAEPRNIFMNNGDGALFWPGGGILDGSEARDVGNGDNTNVLRAGVILGKVTASDRLAPSIIGLLAAAHDTSEDTTTLTLTADQVTEIQRRIGASGKLNLIGPPTADGTVVTEEVTYSAVASSTTLTIEATDADFAAGSIIAPNDGSETPLCVLADEYGVRVTDANGTDVDPYARRLAVAGILNTAKLVDWPTEASTLAWLKSQLQDDGRAFVFSDMM